MAGRAAAPGRTAYVPFRDLDDRRRTTKFLLLRGPGRTRLVRMQNVLHPEATARSDQDRYVYDWAGFTCEIDPRGLRGDWRCHVLVRGRGLIRSAPLRIPVRGRPQRPPYADLGAGTRMVTRWTDDQLCVSVDRLRVIATACSLDGDALELETQLTEPAAHAELMVKLHGGPTVLTFPAHLYGLTCAARLPLDSLVDAETSDDYAYWETYLRLDGGEPIRVAVTGALPETRYPYRARELAVLHTRDGNLSITERTFRPVIESQEWTGDGALVLRGSYLGFEPLEAVLRRRGAGDLHSFPFVRTGTRFEVSLDVRSAMSYGRTA